MKASLFISSSWGKKRFAIAQDDELLYFHVSPAQTVSLLGRVYVGIVQRVMSSMNMVTIDIGEAQAALLAIRGNALVRVGQRLLVQIVRNGHGSKGPVVSETIRLLGYSIVLLSQQPQPLYFSKKLPEHFVQCSEIPALLLQYYPAVSFIIRSAAQYVSTAQLLAEADVLYKEWQKQQSMFQCTLAAGLIASFDYYSIYEWLSNSSIHSLSIVTDHMDEWHILQLWIKKLWWLSVAISWHKSPEPLLVSSPIWSQILALSQRQVRLSSGAHFTIDELPELSFIDVNASYSLKNPIRVTPYDINKEACVHLAQHIKCRQLGGIIIIDFLRMNMNKHKKTLMTQLKFFFEHEVDTHIIGISDLGLVEMTRKRRMLSVKEVWQDSLWSHSMPLDLVLLKNLHTLCEFIRKEKLSDGVHVFLHADICENIKLFNDEWLSFKELFPINVELFNKEKCDPTFCGLKSL